MPNTTPVPWLARRLDAYPPGGEDTGDLLSRTPHFALSALGMCLVVACGGESKTSIDAGPPLVASAQISRDVDILFVIDNTASSGTDELLQIGISSFEENFTFADNTPPNLRIGVVSTDVGAGGDDISDCDSEGDDGMLITQASDCSGPDDAYFAALTLADGSRIANFQGTLSNNFACTARPGLGCGFNQNLEAMRRALDGRNGNFLRKDAMLAIVFFVDEDDCSAHDESVFDADPSLDVAGSALGFLSHFRCFEFGVQCDPDDPRSLGVKRGCVPRRDSPYFTHPDQFVTDIKALKGRDDMLAAYAFMGELAPTVVYMPREEPKVQPSCELNGFPPATPGTRIASFVQSLSRAEVFERCQSGFSESQGVMATSIISGMEGLSCISGVLADVDATQPGLQPGCEVVDVIKLGRGDEERQVVPACADTQALPCYRFDENSPRCGATPQLVVERDASAPLVGATTIAHCEGA